MRLASESASSRVSTSSASTMRSRARANDSEAPCTELSMCRSRELAHLADTVSRTPFRELGLHVQRCPRAVERRGADADRTCSGHHECNRVFTGAHATHTDDRKCWISRVAVKDRAQRDRSYRRTRESTADSSETRPSTFNIDVDSEHGVDQRHRACT